MLRHCLTFSVILLLAKIVRSVVESGISDIHYLQEEGRCIIKNSTVYMDRGPPRWISVHSSTVVHLSLKPELMTNFVCVVTFQSPTEYDASRNQQLMMSFERLQDDDTWTAERYGYMPDPDQAGVGLQHFEKEQTVVAGRPRVKLLAEVRSRSRTLTVVYHGSRGDVGLVITVTNVNSEFESNSSCGALEFYCETSKLCIDEHLQCNGERNCGIYDESDELLCVRLPDHTGFHENSEERQDVGILMGTGVLGVLLTAIVSVWITTVFLRRIRMKRELDRIRREMLAEAHYSGLCARRGGPANLCTRRRGPVYVHQIEIHHGNPNVSLMEPPPCYGPDNGCNSTFEMPPPYTPEACDTAGLLTQTQGLSSETPPAYHMLPPSFDTLRRERCASERTALLHGNNVCTVSPNDNTSSTSSPNDVIDGVGNVCATSQVECRISKDVDSRNSAEANEYLVGGEDNNHLPESVKTVVVNNNNNNLVPGLHTGVHTGVQLVKGCTADTRGGSVDSHRS